MNDPQTIQDALRQAKSTWIGCQWPTQFGSSRLNLEGLRSRQAGIAEKATRGEESRCWRGAAIWLATVEHDAALAAELAEQAVRAAAAGENGEAQRLLGEAVALEQKYRDPIVYQSLLKRFEQSITLQSCCS
ncbi:hypothetical protein RMSM_07144 [Rhodopirellula maiorica SM1]|uniref:Uncharacterized protein n=1 Tax=Rhodopirellula maiorica SM1 TaxID=1265738 RepID=M5R986_9BACT|nr:hypothetical protein [Rhodopirellula maiorica]EMI15935.1 hypothetical protein RMSM_07144 [Rhodopirellula maiorica SM1]